MDNKSLDLPSHIQEKYQKNLMRVKNQKENMQKIKHEIKDEICKYFNCRIGVFGDYKYIYPDGKVGEDVIGFAANQLAKDHKGCFVITGKSTYFYSNEKGEVVTEKTLNVVLQDAVNDRSITDTQYSRILASICNFAIFIITLSRSASMYEEEEFCDNGFDHNILGIGFYIIETDEAEKKIKCECFDIKDIYNIPDKPYYLCKKVIKSEVKCEGSLHNVKYAPISMFINNKFARLIATKYWESIPHIFKEFMSFV